MGDYRNLFRCIDTVFGFGNFAENQSVKRLTIQPQGRRKLFSLEMEQLNCTVEEPFSLNKGDVIDVSIAHVSGELALFIGERDREPIYEGNNPKLNYFRVTIPKEGEYLLSVSGKQAKGSISFQIDKAENK